MAIEDIVHLTAIEDREEREREKQRPIEARERLRDERLRWYDRWLVEDLDRLVSDWERAQRIRAFLTEYERRLPDEARGERSTAWRAAVAAYAANLNPMNQVERIAKEMEPSDETLETSFQNARPRRTVVVLERAWSHRARAPAECANSRPERTYTESTLR